MAGTCKYIDSGRYPTMLKRLIFDDVEICTRDFAKLLQNLIGWSADPRAAYVILDPSPIYYFWDRFKKFPAVEFEAGDSPEVYVSALNEDPGGSPVDAIGTTWWECVVVPPSNKWFVHALRHESDAGGHLWIPAEWNESVRKAYPYFRSELAE